MTDQSGSNKSFVDKINENHVILAIGRVSMTLVVPGFLWLAGQVIQLGNDFSIVQTKIFYIDRDVGEIRKNVEKLQDQP